MFLEVFLKMFNMPRCLSLVKNLINSQVLLKIPINILQVLEKKNPVLVSLFHSHVPCISSLWLCSNYPERMRACTCLCTYTCMQSLVVHSFVIHFDNINMMLIKMLKVKDVFKRTYECNLQIKQLILGINQVLCSVMSNSCMSPVLGDSNMT